MVESPDEETHSYAIAVDVDGELVRFASAANVDGAIMSTTQFISALFAPFDERAAAAAFVNSRNFHQYRVRVSAMLFCVVCSCLNVICLFILKLFDEIQRRLVDDDDGVVELLLHLWRGERDAGIRMHRLFHSIVAGDAWSSAPADDACVLQFRSFFEQNVDRSTRYLLS